MNPASRNRLLIIGGGLIAIALLLVCGPLKGQFGQGAVEPPSVAAGPVPDEAPPVVEVEDAVDEALTGELAATGALAGGALGADGLADMGAAGSKSADASGAVGAAGAVAVVAPPVVAPKATPKSTPKSTPRRRAPLPAVSAPPPVVAAVQAGPSSQQLASLARDAFDSSRPTGLAGNLVDRFAPPVDSGPAPSALALAATPGFATRGASVLRACDTPGAGCQNTVPRAVAGIPPVAGGNPRGGARFQVE